MKDQKSAVEASERRVGRRRFLTGLAGLSAGVGATLAGPVLQPRAADAQPGSPGSTSSAASDPVIASDAHTVVEISSGKLRGYRRNGIYIFKGIPYGASTSGPRRFMAPARPEPWTGIRNALQYGRVCPNRDVAHFSTDGHNLASSDEDAYVLHRGANASVMGEDCLRLNVWTPEINGRGKRPVMVFLHGGGYTSGNAHELLAYDGENLARNHDAVVVSHNHRLNVFGYLNLQNIEGEAFADSANVGLLDLVAALEWVRENIASFGGDPGCVTVFGQSGGGGKVLALMTMPSAKGLFHRAIVQSGPYLKALSPDYSHRVAELVLEELGLTKAQASELQNVSVDRLHAAGMDAISKMPDHSEHSLRREYGVYGWGPTVDGRILPQHFFVPGAPLVSASVPMMTGTNLHEFINGLDRPDAYAMTPAQMEQLVQQGLGGDVRPIIDAYRSEYPRAKPFDLYATIAASSLRYGSFEQARRKTALGAAPAYAYIYSWRTPTLDDRPGPFHAAELALVFDNGEICDHYSALAPDAIALSRQMSAAWVQFARTGNPNHAGLLHWPAYTSAERAVMEFNTQSQVRFDPEGKALRLIAQS